MKTKTPGLYAISSDSLIDTYGYIYKDHFNPLNPTENLISKDDGTCGHNQFKLFLNLQSSVTYVLVMTTYELETIGKFIVVASGPSDITFTRVGEYYSTFLKTSKEGRI